MHITRATPDDAEALTRIAWEAKRSWGYPERWMELWRKTFTITPELIASQELFCAWLDNEGVGFYALRQEGSALWLEHLWVLPCFMKRGVGRALFTHAAEQTRALGFDAFRIESDPNAAGFYERMGAQRIGTTVTEVEGEARELPLLMFRVR
jgi:GNAT superfamily N-acetyltransferase